MSLTDLTFNSCDSGRVLFLGSHEQLAGSRESIRNDRIDGFEVGGIYHHPPDANRPPISFISFLEGSIAQALH